MLLQSSPLTLTVTRLFVIVLVTFVACGLWRDCFADRTQRPVPRPVETREEPTAAAVGAFAWCRNPLQLIVLFRVVMDPAKLKQSRQAMKGWVTTSVNKIKDNHLGKEPEDVDADVLKADLEY